MWSMSSRSRHMFGLQIINLVIQQTYMIQPLSYDARLISAAVSLKSRKISMFIQQNKNTSIQIKPQLVPIYGFGIKIISFLSEHFSFIFF